MRKKKFSNSSSKNNKDLNLKEKNTQNIFLDINEEYEKNLQYFLENLIQYNKNNLNNKKNIALKEILNKFISEESNKNSKNISNTLKNYNLDKFINNLKDYEKLGQFYHNKNNIDDNNDNKDIKYYQVFYRKNNYNSLLEIKIKENTEIILKTNKLIEEKNDKQKTFSKLAHEFKTPLNCIIELINQIKSSTNLNENQETIIENNYDNSFRTNSKIPLKTDNKNENLKLIKNLSHYTIYLINDLIQYFSSDNNSIKNKINTKKNFVKLKKIINFCYDILKTLISCNDKKSISVIPLLIIDNNLKNIYINTDEIRINQILLNFISNSVKFTKSGFVKIIVELIDNREIIISIEDNGMGIKEEEKKFIFNPDKNIEGQIDINYEQNKMGSGLGLSISFAVAQALEHKIFFTSIQGREKAVNFL